MSCISAYTRFPEKQMEERFKFPKLETDDEQPFALCPSGHRCVIEDASSNAPRSVQCPECGADFVARGPFDTASFARK